MLQIFYDSQDFFLLKELEKSGPKKGVISQSVKDVIQSLVDDDLVFKDKIGTSVSRCFHIQLCIVDDDQFSSVIREQKHLIITWLLSSETMKSDLK
ncbi:meiotic nuclear division protein 1 homolog [Prunus avium]|uniref:Meiotic nuclear division protein 1 homolog n=1 Tax=Prunus avium TaxID=42229 RepID=A0A6P5T7L5_PRUAV|nr:meiotic nuclear division protein 1 homolog [Prunus avium]XP_021832318.1 meiotic nuclear division protein 1 homolog [Prunus avium]